MTTKDQAQKEMHLRKMSAFGFSDSDLEKCKRLSKPMQILAANSQEPTIRSCIALITPYDEIHIKLAKDKDDAVRLALRYNEYISQKLHKKICDMPQSGIFLGNDHKERKALEALLRTSEPLAKQVKIFSEIAAYPTDTAKGRILVLEESLSTTNEFATL